MLLNRSTTQDASQELRKDISSAQMDSDQNWSISKATRIESMESSTEPRTRTWGSALVEEDVYIGLVIESKPPHLVAEVRGVTDVNYVQQGAPGYANEPVHVGDTLIAVDGRSCISAGVEGIHGLLKGVARTPVELTLARRGGQRRYKVTVMRHRRDVQLDAELIQYEEYQDPDPIVQQAKTSNLSMAKRQDEPGLVGLKLSLAPPFVVEAVSNNLILAPGSQRVEVGDRLTSVDGQSVPSTLNRVHTLLEGSVKTEVVLGLSRRSKLYTVRVIRHRRPKEVDAGKPIEFTSADKRSMDHVSSRGTNLSLNVCATPQVRILCSS